MVCSYIMLGSILVKVANSPDLNLGPLSEMICSVRPYDANSFQGFTNSCVGNYVSLWPLQRTSTAINIAP